MDDCIFHKRLQGKTDHHSATASLGKSCGQPCVTHVESSNNFPDDEILLWHSWNRMSCNSGVADRTSCKLDGGLFRLWRATLATRLRVLKKVRTDCACKNRNQFPGGFLQFDLVLQFPGMLLSQFKLGFGTKYTQPTKKETSGRVKIPFVDDFNLLPRCKFFGTSPTSALAGSAAKLFCYPP